MLVCDAGHEELVYDNSSYKAECPACKLLALMGEQDDKIESLESGIEALQAEINDLELASLLRPSSEA